MKNLALGIWDDLREKRLWPLAVALLIALIAVPLFVIKPAAEPAPTGADAQPRQAESTPAVRVVDDASRESSRLGIFGKKDPFRPPAAALAPSTSSSTSTAAAAGASAPTGAGTSSGLPSAPTPTGGSGPSGGSGATGGGSAPAPAPGGRLRRTTYTYVVDLDFGRDGRTRLRRGVPRLKVLPNARSPVAVFLGVSASAKRAVFLLNPAFEQRGEGTCRPSRARCNFLHLSTDAEKNGHRIVDGSGVTYVLRLKAIRRVPVREASRASRRGPRARAGTKSRAGHSPVFADEQR